MKKLKTNTEWLNLAVSKDKYRPNISEIYIDNGTAIATNGERLHMVNNYKPNFTGYLSNNESNFPDYKLVLSTNKIKVCNILRCEAIGIIAFLQGCIAMFDKKKTVVTLKSVHNKIQIDLTVNFIKASYVSDIEAQSDINVKLSANYLIDALLMSNFEKEISIYQGNSLPVSVESNDYTAVIMPCR